MAVDDPLLALVGKPGGPLADAELWSLSVLTVTSITADYRRVNFEGPNVEQLRFRPGQDLMLRIPGPEDRITNRRYTIRAADRSAATVTVDMVVHGDGPGARWAADAAPGHRLDAIGPRGKIWLDEAADWHLFIGDETALPGMSIMAEVLPAGAPATMVVELPDHVGGLDPQLGDDQHVAITWIERGDAQPGEPTRLVAVAEEIPFPPGRGHAYVAGEMKVVRSLAAALAARGLDGSAVDAKAY
jgi:NADPH-dependent ferric siderophore reductase